MTVKKGGDEHPELVRPPLRARGAVCEQVERLLLDAVLHLASLAVHALVQRLGLAFEVGDDEPGVAALRPVLDAGDDPAAPVPGAGVVVELGEQPALDSRRLEALLGRLAPQGRLALEHPVAGKADDVPDIVPLAPGQHPVPAKGGVPPQHDAHLGPLAAKAFDEQREYRPGVARRIDVRGAKVGAKQLRAAKHIQRHEEVPVVVPVEEPPFLLPVHRVVGRVEVQDELLGRTSKRGDEPCDEHLVNRPRPRGPGPVLEPAKRRGARKRPELFARRLHHRVVSKLAVVVEVLVSQRHPMHSLAQHRRDPVAHLAALARIGERARDRRGQSEPAVDLAQQQCPAIGGNPIIAKMGLHPVFAAD